MQTLKFNTTTKVVQLFEDNHFGIMQSFDNISTVKCSELGFYEIMQKQDLMTNSSIPVMRVPIANTNMIIIK